MLEDSASSFGFRSGEWDAYGHHKQWTFRGGVGRKEPRRIVIVESQPGRSPVQRVAREIGAAREDAGLEVHVAIAAIPERYKNVFEVRHIDDKRRAVIAKHLLEA